MLLYLKKKTFKIQFLFYYHIMIINLVIYASEHIIEKNCISMFFIDILFNIIINS